MLRKHFNEVLKKERDNFLKTFRKELIDVGNVHRLGDLFGYFTEHDTILQNGVLSFEVGDFTFQMYAIIDQREDQKDPLKTNKITFRTIETINDILRANKQNEGKHHIKKLDIILYFANKKGMQYDNAFDRVRLNINGLGPQLDISGNILEKYGQELIRYIEDVETRRDEPQDAIKEKSH